MRLEFWSKHPQPVKTGKPKAPVFAGSPAASQKPGAASPLLSLQSDIFTSRTGPKAIRFGAASEKEIEESRGKLAEAENLARAKALRKLLEADNLDEKTLKALARYLYFEDTYLTNEEPPIRVANRFRLIQLMEKFPNLWGAEALTMQMVEYGNSTTYPFSKYAGVVLSRIYPSLPKEAQLRIRSLMYGALLTESSSTLREHVPPILSKFAPAEDASYIWYLIRKSGMTNSSNNDYFRRIFTHALAKEHGLALQETALDLYKDARNGNPAPDISEDDLKIMLREFPMVLLHKSDAELDKMTRAEITQAVSLITESVLELQRNKQSDSTADFYGVKVLSRLLKRMPLEEREAYLDSIALRISESPSSHKEFVALILHQLYRDSHNMETMKRFVNKKNTTFYDRVFENMAEKAAATSSKLDLTELMPEDESDILECKETEQPLYSQYIDSKAQPPAGKTWLTHFMSGPLPDSPRLPFESRYKPVGHTQDRWDFEPLVMIANANFSERCEQLDIALEKGDKNLIYEALEPFTHDWLYQNSSQDYRYLMEMTQQPAAFKVFMEQMLHILKDESRKVPLFVPANNGTVPPRKRITDISSQELAPHLKQLVALLSSAIESYKGQSQDALMDVSELCSVLAKRDPDLRPILLATLFKGLQIETSALEQAKKDAPATNDNKPKMEKIRLKYLGASVLSILRMGYTDQLIRDHGKQIQMALNSVEPDTLLKPDIGFSYLKWNDLSDNKLESKVDADRVSPESKKDFDLYVDLAVKSNDDQAMASAVNRLYEHYLTVRDNSYADEIFMMKHLSNPELTRFVLNQSNDQVFERFTEMQGWYKAFESVPDMVAKAAEKNVPLRVSAIKAASAMMGNFARGDLQKILAGGSAREKAVAQDILKRMENSGFEWELFYPYPFPLPASLMKRLEQLKNTTDNTQIPSSPGGNPFRPITDDQAFDLDAMLAEPPKAIEPGASPEGVDGDSFVEAASPIDFMGLEEMDPSMLASSQEAPQTLIEQIREAFNQMKAADFQNRDRYVNQMVALVEQFGAMALNANSGIEFISPEKTELANLMAQRLPVVTNKAEQTGLLQSMLVLGGDADVILPAMLRLINNSNTDSEHVILALKILGNLGAGGTEDVRELMYRQSWINGTKKQAVETMIQLRDGEGLVGAIENRNRMMMIDGVILEKIIEGLGEVAPGDPELEVRTRAVLLPLLEDGNPNFDVQLEVIKTLCLIADPSDMDLMNRIANQLLDTPGSREGKRELIKAITSGFFDNTPDVQLVLRKFARGTDAVVQRYAREAMALLGLADNP